MSIVQVEQVGSNTVDRAALLLAGIPGGVEKAQHSALKRAADTAKTKAGQFAASEYTVSKGIFMSNVKIKITQGNLSENIEFAGAVIPLQEFATQYGKTGYISTRIKRSGGAAALRRAFFLSLRKGGWGIFERQGSPDNPVGRLPINKIFGPSAGHMMQNDEVVDKMDETIQETYDKRIEVEINRLLNGFGG